MGAYINKACGRARGACFRRTRGGGRSIGRAVVFFHAPFGSSPQKLRTFSHTKIIIRSTCAHCARKKRAAVCIFQPFEGVFFFLLYALCAKRTRVFCSLRATAVSQSLHPQTSGGECLRFRGHRALFLHGEQAKELSLPLDGANRCTKRPNRRRTHRVSVGGLAVNG